MDEYVTEVIMNVRGVTVAAALLLAVSFGASAQPASQTQAKAPLASVESRWSDVYCDLLDLSRPTPSELSVRFQWRNQRGEPFRPPNVELVPNTHILDAANLTLYGVLKDTEGKAIASGMLNGALARSIPAGRAQAHFARLTPPPEGVKAVTVLIDGCLPFENAAIGGTPSAEFLSKPAAAIATQDGEDDGLVVEVVRMARGSGGLLDLVVRYTNKGSANFRFPNNASPPSRRFASAYVVDSENRRKFVVVTDKTGRPLSSESTEFSGSLGETLEPGEALNLWAKLAGPPESTKQVSLYVALAPPVDGVALSGTGAGAADAGSSVEGEAVGLQAALANLDAKVSDAEIRIDLAADVLFDFDRAEIKQEAEASLQNVATVVRANPGATVSIEGHTDGRGADDYNQKLSEARAASVKQWLVAHAQVNGASVATRGWGKTKPVAPNAKPDGSDDPDGRAKNRRVEIVVRKIV
jgi:outer membrane protein OmpA-like peptidoglycan-associated protein